MSDYLTHLVDAQLWAQVLVGMFCGVIVGLDRLLDMCRTAVNVAGDLVACAFVDKWVMRDFQPPLSSAQPASGSDQAQVLPAD
jgi:Na+/H+-dicarboxylate symporter